MEARPGEEEDDEPEIEETSVGKKRRVLRLGSREIVLEKGCEGLRAMSPDAGRLEDEEEWNWGVKQAMEKMISDRNEEIKSMSMLNRIGANKEEADHAMQILMKEQGVSGRDSISGFVMHCRKRNEETEMLRKMHRNWYLDRVSF